MRWVTYLIALILAASLVSASSIFIKDELKEGETKAYSTDDGVYVLKVVLISNKKEAAMFELNNKEETRALSNDEGHGFKDSSEIIVRDILISSRSDDTVSFFFYGTGKDIIEVEIPGDFAVEDCNFNGICEDESTSACCYDCGCEEGYRCIKNRCVRTVGCTSDEDCDDNAPCTKDLCQDDKCIYPRKDGCVLNDECLSYGTIRDIDGKSSYCLDDRWNIQKNAGEECNNAFECSSGMCEENRCYKPKNKGLFTMIVIVMLAALVIVYIRKYKLYGKIKKKLFFRF